jgi:hypothetical protein
MAEVDATHTLRQAALIKGEVQPDTNEEWSYVQEHTSDILSGTDKAPETIGKGPGFVIVPHKKGLNLHKPKDIGETSWQKRDD